MNTESIRTEEPSVVPKDAGRHSRRRRPPKEDRASDGSLGEGTGGATPVWFEYLVVVGCAGVLSFGGFGLLLAVLGRFSAAPAFLLGAAGTAVGALLGRPARGTGADRSPAKFSVPAAGACLLALSVAAWNSIYIGHHVAAASDPGVYAVAGRWLASHGTLVVQGGAPWIDKGSTFNWGSAGMYPAGGGTLQFQFSHGLPVLLAEGHLLGGDALMFRVPAVLGALALCAVYAAGCRLIRRPWLVLAAVAALAITLPQLYVTRDTFSEPATEVLLWGGIWLLLRAYQERRVGVALFAGLVLGGTMITRIDAVAYLIPLPILAAVGWLVARSADDRRSLLRLYAAVTAGVLPPAILGTVDVQRRAGGYYDALHHEVRQLYILLGLALILAFAVLLFGRSLARPVEWFGTRRRQLSVIAAWIVGTGLVLAWSVRPAGPKSLITGPIATVVGNLQKAEGLPVRPESYSEQTVQWISWYIGPIALALAIAGLCLLTVMAIRGAPVALVVLAMAGPLTAIYLWNPNITPIQMWAMRRYVPASLPLLLLAAAVAIDGAASACQRLLQGRAWPRGALLAGGTAMILFPVGVLLPVRSFQTQANYLPVIDKTCHVIGPDAAVLFPAYDYDSATLTQTLRSWCNVPAAWLTRSITAPQLEAVAADFRAEGRTLWVLDSDPTLIRRVSPALVPTLIGTGQSSRELEQTVDHPPQDYAQSVLTLYGAEVP